MDEKLKQQIEERKKEALSKDFLSKGIVIAQMLGTYSSRYTWASSQERCATYIFKRGKLEIRYEKEEPQNWVLSHSIVISYDGKVVLRQANSHYVGAYIPGPWEEEVLALLPEATGKQEESLAAEQQRKERIASEEERKEREKWGL